MVLMLRRLVLYPSFHTVCHNCDALLIVGSCFPYIEFLPKPGQAVGVQIDEGGSDRFQISGRNRACRRRAGDFARAAIAVASQRRPQFPVLGPAANA